MIISIAVAAIFTISSPCSAAVTDINVVDPPAQIINETSTGVYLIGLELVNDASGSDTLQSLQLMSYNELPFAGQIYKVYQVRQGSGAPTLRRSVSTIWIPLEYASLLTVTNIGALIDPGHSDTIWISMDVFTDTVSTRCVQYDGTGVQICIPGGSLAFSSGAAFPAVELCPSVFDPGPPPSGYLVVFDTEAPVCGDASGNCVVNVSDIVYLISYVFAEGPSPDPMSAGDVDCNAAVNVSDIVWLISYMFGDGYAPCDTDGNDEADC
jgi:hypothetical protein